MIGETPISWRSKKQGIISISSCEANYVATLNTTCQTSLMEMLLKESKFSKIVKSNFLGNNIPIINVSHYPMSHGRSKNIKQKYHFLRDQVIKHRLEIEYCKTELQLVDILTKLLKRARFEGLKELTGMRN